LRRFRTPHFLERRGGCKAHYGFGGEGEDLEAAPSPFTALMGGEEGEGLALEGLDVHPS
jgi:hypothetical protein